MRSNTTLLTVLSAWILCAETQAQAPAPLANFEQRVRVEVLRDKRTRIKGGDADDKTDQVSFTVKFTNTDTRASFESCKGEFYVFAESILNRKAFKLLGADEFEFSLPPRGAYSFSSKETITMWDRTDARFGAKYDAWVLVVRDGAGKVLLKKSSLPAWLPVAEQMNTLNENSFYGRDLKPARER